MATTQPIRSKTDLRKLVDFYLLRGEYRNHALIVLGVHSALRISDILRLRWGDVYDFSHRRFRAELSLAEKKTGKAKIIPLHKEVTRALSRLFLEQRPAAGGFLIENPNTRKAISRIQAYRLIRAAGEAIELERPVACHSLRKTFGYFAWKHGASPAVIMEIFNHSSYEVTRRYLGIAQEDKDKVYLSLALLA